MDPQQRMLLHVSQEALSAHDCIPSFQPSSGLGAFVVAGEGARLDKSGSNHLLYARRPSLTGAAGTPPAPSSSAA
jgi:acyl transferase domain-containing protein